MRSKGSSIVCAALVIGLSACAARTSGRKYTFAKMNADRRTFVEAKTVLPAREDAYDRRIEHGECIGLSINGGYLRFLNDIERPEVAIFARVRITPPEAPEESHVIEGVYLHSEQHDDIQMEGDAFFPRTDIPILPGLKYEGQDIQVQLRIIEIDGDDRKRVKNLINAAASSGAALSPENAAAISVFQTVLSFLNENNSDDIEFQFDFGISESNDTIVHRWRRSPEAEELEERYDLVLQPRIATYVAIKTEHPGRLHISGNYFDVAQGGLRYVVAQALKLGTLGLFNWPIWSNVFNADPEDDFYLRVMGRPFGIPRSAWRLPTWHTGQLTIEIDGQGVFEPQFEVHALTLENGDLVATPGLFQPCDPVSARSGNHPLFDDQGYIVVSVTRPATGVDLTKLRTLEAWKRTLEFRTQQLAPEDMEKSLEDITNALKTVAKERQKKAAEKEEKSKRRAAERAVRDSEAVTLAKIADAQTAAELAEAQAGHEKALADANVPPELANASRETISKALIDRARALNLDPTPYALMRFAGPRFVVLATAEASDEVLGAVLPPHLAPTFQLQVQQTAAAAAAPEVIELGDRTLYRFRVPVPAGAAITARILAFDSSGKMLGTPLRRVYLRGVTFEGPSLDGTIDLVAPFTWTGGDELRLRGNNLTWRDPDTNQHTSPVTTAKVWGRTLDATPKELEGELPVQVLVENGVPLLVTDNSLGATVQLLRIELSGRDAELGVLSWTAPPPDTGEGP